MKFGKLLKETTEGMPEMEDLFLRYKELKKHLKAMKKAPPQVQADAAAQDEDQQEEASTSGNQEQAESRLSAEETAFVNTLNEDLQRFNRFFIDREEDSVIKLQALSDRIKAATEPEQLQALKTELVDFHGEMVLLLHWSLLNYAAVVKILKKHDKRSGLLLRAPYLANVLQQPFYSTSVMSRLVKSAEEHINSLVVKQQSAASPQTPPPPPAAAAAGGPAAAADTAEAFEVSNILGGGGDNPPDRVSTPPPTAESAAAAPAGLATPTQPAAAAARAETPPPPAAVPDSKSQAGSPAEQQRLPVDTAVFARTRMALQTWDTLCNNASTPSTVLPPTGSDLVRALQVRERWAKIVGVQHTAAAPADGTAGAIEQDTQQQQQQQQHSSGEAVTAAVGSTAAGVAHPGHPESSSRQQRQHEAPEIEQLDAAAVKRQRC